MALFKLSTSREEKGLARFQSVMAVIIFENKEGSRDSKG